MYGMQEMLGRSLYGCPYRAHPRRCFPVADPTCYVAAFTALPVEVKILIYTQLVAQTCAVRNSFKPVQSEMMNNNNMRGRGKRSNRARGGRALQRDTQMIPRPPQLPSYGITRDVRMRFLSNAAASTNITFQNLLDTVLFATTTVAGFDLFDAVRINSIEMWAASVTGAPVTLSLIFSGTTVGAVGDDKLHTDTSMGIEPAHVRARPDPLTQAGQFQENVANTAFELQVPTGTVIDVSMTLRQPVLGSAVAVQNPLVAATPGVLYYRGLDGKALATTVYPVVGTLSTI
jgi:hypothetical protein